MHPEISLHGQPVNDSITQHFPALSRSPGTPYSIRLSRSEAVSVSFTLLKISRYDASRAESFFVRTLSLMLRATVFFWLSSGNPRNKIESQEC